MLRFRSPLLALAVGLSAALSSCSSARYFDFTTASSRQSAYHAVAAKPTAPTSLNPVAAPATEVVVAEAPALAAPNLTASNAPETAPLPATREVAVPATAPAAPRLSEQLTSARAGQNLTRAQERRYERVLNRAKKAEAKSTRADGDANLILQIILCLLPPLTLLGVYLHENAINTKFWITLIGLIFFVLPGVIYGLLVVTDII